jgi:ribonuclease Z
MGIVPLLRNVLFPPPAGSQPSTSSYRAPVSFTLSCNRRRILSITFQPKIEIYGPAGIRTFVRQVMKMTFTNTADNYTVHELLSENDPVTPCDHADPVHPVSRFAIAEQNILHLNEVAGKNIRTSVDGSWKNITRGSGVLGDIVVNAGPIEHRGKLLIGQAAEISTEAHRFLKIHV